MEEIYEDREKIRAELTAARHMSGRDAKTKQTPLPNPQIFFENCFFFVFVKVVALVAAAVTTTTGESAGATLGNLGLRDSLYIDGDIVELDEAFLLDDETFLGRRMGDQGEKETTYAEVLEQVAGLGVDLELARLGVLGEVESRNLRNKLILALTLLLLKLEGDTTNGSTLNTLHQMSGVSGNLHEAELVSNSNQRHNSPQVLFSWRSFNCSSERRVDAPCCAGAWKQ